MTSPDPTVAVPQAWRDLIEGLTMLAQHPVDDDNPLHCEHDVLYVHANEQAFTDAEIVRLDQLGFSINEREGGFSSSRFGN